MGLTRQAASLLKAIFFQGRFRADDTTDAELYDDRNFEDRLIYNDVVFHYKHIGVLAEGGHREKGIDVRYALEIYELTLFRDFVFIVLITGDADHEMLARKIKALKKQVVLLTWNFAEPDSTSPALKEECILSKMNCYYHPNRPVVAQCPDCGKGLCPECASKYEKPICAECNEKRGRNEQRDYLKPLIICSILFAVGCVVGVRMGETSTLMGYIFTCIYGGWSIVAMFFSNIFVSLNIQSIIFYYGLRIILSIIVGVFATPIFLGYCVFKLIQLKTRQ